MMTVQLVNGVALHEPSSGNPDGGPLMLFVHGGSHGAWCFGELMARLAASGQAVAALDWYSHGSSAAALDFVTRNLEDVAAEEITTAVRHYAPRPVILVGHSMGGLAVLLAAGPLREHLVGLGLLAPAIPASIPGRRSQHAPYRAGRVYNTRRWPLPVVRAMFFPELPRAEAKQLRDRLVPESGRVIRETVLRTLDVDLEPLRELPTTIVCGTRDRLVRPLQAANLALELFARFRPLPGIGHGLWCGPALPDTADSLTRLAERIAAQ